MIGIPTELTRLFIEADVRPRSVGAVVHGPINRSGAVVNRQRVVGVSPVRVSGVPVLAVVPFERPTGR